jgi:small subunit ribosomal protein S18
MAFKRQYKKPRSKFGFEARKKKVCRFCENKILAINYKDDKLLRRFLTERGKIIPRRISGNCAKHQRELNRALKRARQLALVPYLADMYH